MKTDIAILGEQIEVLNGTLTREKRKAAVRIEDLTGIFQINQKIQSKFSVAAPTKVEFDAVIRDINEIATALTLVAKALNQRMQQP